MTSGVLENPNNSLQSRFKNQSQRQERNREKQLNLESITGRETMKLRAQAKDDKLEITKLRKQIEVLSPATPQTPIHNVDDQLVEESPAMLRSNVMDEAEVLVYVGDGTQSPSTCLVALRGVASQMAAMSIRSWPPHEAGSSVDLFGNGLVASLQQAWYAIDAPAIPSLPQPRSRFPACSPPIPALERNYLAIRSACALDRISITGKVKTHRSPLALDLCIFAE
ncbi:hypothetical protein B0H13DRAFT_1887145 [Mycena leptocephala]|nr:hypothetical protein B0H13DRAFT_1887145 [Mycena leptocephala]